VARVQVRAQPQQGPAQVHPGRQPVLGEAATALVGPQHRHHGDAQVAQLLGEGERRRLERIGGVRQFAEVDRDHPGARRQLTDQRHHPRTRLDLQDRHDAGAVAVRQMTQGSEFAATRTKDRPIDLVHGSGRGGDRHSLKVAVNVGSATYLDVNTPT
jgi:hypothetical protein